MGKSDTIGDKLVNHRSSHIRVPQGSNRIESLLISAVPKDVGTLGVHLASSSFFKGNCKRL
jgi:hypothetical protein